MDPRKPGSKDMPDFDELNDRLIAKHTSEPTLVIKTNLDSKDVRKDNPYYKGEQTDDQQEFEEFFEE